MIKNLLAAASLALIAAVPANAKDLDVTGIEDAILDRPLSFVHGNKKGTITYASSNHVIIKNEDGTEEYGEWESDGDKLCARMDSDYDKRSCFTVSRTSEEYDETAKFRTSSGMQMTGENF